MQTISVEAMRSAIVFLFNRMKGPRYADGDLERYAAIGAFMTNEEDFKTAMREVAAKMLGLLKSSPEVFEIKINGGLYARQKALGNNRVQDGFLAQAQYEIEQEKGPNVATLYKEPDPKKPQQVKSFNSGPKRIQNDKAHALIDPKLDAINQREEQFIKNNPGFFSEDTTKNFIARRFHFHKLLKEAEKAYSFVDNGLILMADLIEGSGKSFGDILRKGEVWKDSIAATHGEYTHRLQWLAVAQHFAVDRGSVKAFTSEDINRLYKGCANALRTKYANYYKANKQANDAYPTGLWEFLFDSFVVSSVSPHHWNGAVTPVDLPEDRSKPELKQDEVALLGALRHSGRTDSYRSPTNVTSMLRTDATMGLLHAYIACSSLKAPILVDGKVQGGSEYRRQRLSAKYGGDYSSSIFFEPHAGTAIHIGTTI